jgi:CheY-like chemotaxis protein
MDSYASKPLNVEEIQSIITEYFSYKIVETQTSEILIEDEIHPLVEDLDTEVLQHDEVTPIKEELEESDILETLETLENLSFRRELKENKDEKNVEIIKADILLYKQIPLALDVYLSIFNNLGYSVEVALNEDDFIDKVEENNYIFALFDEEAFSTMQGLVVDIIKDKEILPFIFVIDKDKERDCCEILSIEANVEEIKRKFNKKS